MTLITIATVAQHVTMFIAASDTTIGTVTFLLQISATKRHLLTYNCNHPHHDIGIKWYPNHGHEEGEGIPVSPAFLLAIGYRGTTEGMDRHSDAPRHLSPETTFSGLHQWWYFFSRTTFLRLVVVSSDWWWRNKWWHSWGSLLLLWKCTRLSICWIADNCRHLHRCNTHILKRRLKAEVNLEVKNNFMSVLTENNYRIRLLRMCKYS